MLPSEDLSKQNLIDAILDLSIIEQERYFQSLTIAQREYVKDLLQLRARPKALCDLFDDKASFSDWIQSHFYIPELNGQIWLAQYQIDALNEATKKDANGLYAYSLIAWLDIKKSIKSCIAGAVALRMAFMSEWGSVKVVANKAEQAASRSYFYITRSLKLNPQTAKMIEDGHIKINNYTINFYFNNSSIRAIPLNPEGEAGGNDDLIIWTEAWAAKNKAAQTMFTEMVIPPNKFGKGFKWLESYAGFSGESPILEPIYKENVKEEYKLKDDMYANGRTFALCNHSPRLPWQTPEYYEQQRKELVPSEFNRVHRNLWQSSTQKFIDDIQWDLCKKKLPPLKEKERLILALDVGLSDDCFAIVGVNKVDGKIAVRIVKVWQPKKNQKLHFSNPTNDKSKDIEYPYGYIKHLCNHYKVLVLVYDPYQAEKLAEDLTKERAVNCQPFNQKAERNKSDKYLLDLIRERNIIHDDIDILNEHISNADSKNEGDNKLRIIKRSNDKKIDATIALSMAAYTSKDYR